MPVGDMAWTNSLANALALAAMESCQFGTIAVWILAPIEAMTEWLR